MTDNFTAIEEIDLTSRKNEIVTEIKTLHNFLYHLVPVAYLYDMFLFFSFYTYSGIIEFKRITIMELMRHQGILGQTSAEIKDTYIITYLYKNNQ